MRRSATVDQWDVETVPDAPLSMAELVEDGHYAGPVDSFVPSGMTVEFPEWEDGPRCESCGKGVREGLRFCSGLSECFLKGVER
jgi:hypothetical protein